MTEKLKSEKATEESQMLLYFTVVDAFSYFQVCENQNCKSAFTLVKHNTKCDFYVLRKSVRKNEVCVHYCKIKY